MTWLRRRRETVDEHAVAEVARALESAASAAPRSPRETAIREALLESLDTRPRGGTALLRPMAFVATMLIALLAVTAAPGIVSNIGQIGDPPNASATAPGIGSAGDKAPSTIPKDTMLPPERSTATASPGASGSPSPTGPASEEGSPGATPTIAPPTPTEPPLPIPTLPITPTLPPPPQLP